MAFTKMSGTKCEARATRGGSCGNWAIYTLEDGKHVCRQHRKIGDNRAKSATRIAGVAPTKSPPNI